VVKSAARGHYVDADFAYGMWLGCTLKGIWGAGKPAKRRERKKNNPDAEEVGCIRIIQPGAVVLQWQGSTQWKRM
jgi:hypothetical protein